MRVGAPLLPPFHTPHPTPPFSLSLSLALSRSLSRPHFEACIAAFTHVTMMAINICLSVFLATDQPCSYNSVNGIPACAHPMLQSEIRDRSKFEGYIVSDCGSSPVIALFARSVRFHNHHMTAPATFYRNSPAYACVLWL